MITQTQILTVRLSQPDGTTYRLDLEGPDVGERSGTFTPPYDPPTWAARYRVRALDSLPS